MRITIDADDWWTIVSSHVTWSHTYYLNNGMAVSGDNISVVTGTKHPAFTIEFDEEKDALFFLLSYGGKIVN